MSEVLLQRYQIHVGCHIWDKGPFFWLLVVSSNWRNYISRDSAFNSTFICYFPCSIILMKISWVLPLISVDFYIHLYFFYYSNMSLQFHPWHPTRLTFFPYPLTTWYYVACMLSRKVCPFHKMSKLCSNLNLNYANASHLTFRMFAD